MFDLTVRQCVRLFDPMGETSLLLTLTKRYSYDSTPLHYILWLKNSFQRWLTPAKRFRKGSKEFFRSGVKRSGLKLEFGSPQCKHRELLEFVRKLDLTSYIDLFNGT